MELTAAIKRIIETGQIELGSRSTADNLLSGKARLVVVAKSCPKKTRADLNHYSKLAKIPVITFDGNGVQLGEACGKPFAVAALAVTDPGVISITDLLAESKKEKPEESKPAEQDTTALAEQATE